MDAGKMPRSREVTRAGSATWKNSMGNEFPMDDLHYVLNGFFHMAIQISTMNGGCSIARFDYRRELWIEFPKPGRT